MKLTAPQALRVAEEEQRMYVAHVLAALLAAPSAVELPAYKLLLGDRAGRMEAASAIARLATQLEAMEEPGE
jgi:hypothetical protein